MAKPEILFVADQNNGNIGAKVFDFGDPFLGDILQGVGRIDREAHQYDIGIGIRKGSKPIIIFLTSSIPKGQLNLKMHFYGFSLMKNLKREIRFLKGFEPFLVGSRIKASADLCHAKTLQKF